MKNTFSLGTGLRIGLTAALMALALIGGVVRPAQAASLVVNSANDNDDGTCNTTHCSLREAINAANAAPGADTITFNLGTATIIVLSPLPALTGNGTTIQGGGTITVEGLGINGSGFTIYSNNNRIQGLTITQFSQRGVYINGMSIQAANNVIGTNGDGVSDSTERNIITANGWGGVSIDGAQASGNIVAGNIIGLEADGTTANGNGGAGVNLSLGAHHNRVGTNGDGISDSLERNIISRNDTHGVYLYGDRNTVAGNYIGTDASGTSGKGNHGAGIGFFYGDFNVIGPGNVIGDNDHNGIEMGGATGNTIFGNFIGTDATGTQTLGNHMAGIRIFGYASEPSNRNKIGFRGNYSNGIEPNGNIIAYNDFVGIAVEFNGYQAIENAILYNSIHSNGGIGIELVPSGFDGCWDGVTTNDAGDGDGGGNNGLNMPVVLSATSGGATTTVQAEIADGLPNTTFIIQFFSSPSCDGTNYGEGKTYLGEVTVTTDGSGDATSAVTSLPVATPAGYWVTATATIYGSAAPMGTSEFSACKKVN